MNARFSIREAIAYGFRTYFNHFLFCVALVLVQGIVAVLALGLVMLPFVWLQGEKLYTVAMQLRALQTEAFVSPEHYVQVITQSHVLLPLSIFLALVVLMIQLLMVFFQLGWAKVAFKLHDRNEESYGEFFASRSYLLRGIVVGIIYSALVGLGLMLFVVPGIMIAIMLYFWPQVLVDHNTTISQTLRMTMAITRGYRWHILLFAAALHLLNVLAVLPYSLGLLILIPVLAITKVYAYRHSENLPAVVRR